MTQITDSTPAPSSGEPASAPQADPAGPDVLRIAAPAADPSGTASRPAFRLQRSRSDRIIGGVCGGLAESLAVDAALIRIGLVLLMVFGAGIGLVFYVAAWALAPETASA